MLFMRTDIVAPQNDDEDFRRDRLDILDMLERLKKDITGTVRGLQYDIGLAVQGKRGLDSDDLLDELEELELLIEDIDTVRDRIIDLLDRDQDDYEEQW